MAKSENPAKGVVWNLSNLYLETGDPRIEKDKKQIESLAKAFRKKYKGKINYKALSAKGLVGALQEAEALTEKLYIYSSYASYLHSKDTESHKIGSFYQEADEFVNKISTELLWFLLEIQQLPKKKANNLLQSPELKEYRHYLAHARVFSPFRKSLEEEEIIKKLEIIGGDAFVRFYDETSSSEEFPLDGKRLNYSEIVSIAKDDPDAKKRKQASEAITRTYLRNKKFYTFTLNTLLLEKKTKDEIRGYKYPQQETFLGYEVDPKTVESLQKVITENLPLSERYYKAKAKVSGRKLYEWDRYSTLYHDDNKISWVDAKNIVLESFFGFDQEFGNIAKMFFDNEWIDAEVAKGKKNGAFCSYCTPSKNPFILLSYTGTVDDVMTLAHELGHGVHAYLSRGNSLHNYYPSTATAEIASVFAESLVFDHLYKNTKTKKEKLNLLTNKIQGSLATIFRQILFYEFEEKIHLHRRQEGELSTDDFNNYFQQSLQKMFGKGLTLTEEHKYWWMPVLHFYHYNFYVFTYAFGEALTLALYYKYKRVHSFAKNYKKALSLGGSISPREITSLMGVNISNSSFWQEGINLLKDYVMEFEELARKDVK